MQFCFKKQCYFYVKKKCFNRNHAYVDTSKKFEKNKILESACFFNGKSRILIDYFLYFGSDSAFLKPNTFASDKRGAYDMLSA